ncbi:nuclear transport factor 2 family protein [Zavarzinia sp. CC-PAN008]|uniref:nuclear transport factor 2 family protein n=1 Tax=Zavarzinia sp. CC-PAN008 TaxID=3243332 RepID=UPI003F7481A2
MADSPAEIEAVAQRFVTALETGDLEGIRALYAPDVRVWHNTDQVEQDLETTLGGVAWFFGALHERRYLDIRRQVYPGGFVQQFVMTGRTNKGEAFRWPGCMVVAVAGGRITRLDEYLDSAGAAPLLA